MKPKNVRSGFKKCGIYPFSREALLSQLPEDPTVVEPLADGSIALKESVAITLIDFLKEKRFGASDVGESSNRGKKLGIPAGKSASVDDMQLLLAAAEAREAKAKGRGGRKRAKPVTWSSTEPVGLNLTIKKS
jgi:hypothetical protein